MSDIMVISSLLKEYTVRRDDAIKLLAHMFGCSYHDLFFKTHVNVPLAIQPSVCNGLRRLASGEPVSKIIQKKEFYGIEFKTNKYTMDPRPETELIIDLVTKYYRSLDEHLTILDLGSGTGCIGLSLLTMYKNAVCSFVDIDANAIAVALENACNLDVSTRCEFILSDWFTNVSGIFDIITCNPPYVSTNFELDVATSFDPEIALFAGEEGMNAYITILPKMKNFLKRGGKAFIEVGFDQREKVANIEHGMKVVSINNDLNGIPRVITLCLFDSF
ncbi:MAG: peptide chain release factor N(5)-glutamine methyltransferase [Holosporales bacterium]|jgi:release factor glutamine methyltransferase|nr:peptide chain release factor N(5)-glutamine methyltransferase [Holosporales bacterium]